MASLGQLRKQLRINTLTGVVVDVKGGILRIVAFDEPPSHTTLIDLLRPYRPCAFSMYVKGDYSEEVIKRRIAEAVNGIKLDHDGALDGGANCL